MSRPPVGQEEDGAVLEERVPAEPPGERLSFTAAYPSRVVADLWQTLLVVLHTPGRADEVAELLGQRARDLGSAPTRISTEATAPVRRGTTVTLVPTVAGVEFNPARLDVTWHEDVQESSFRMRTSAAEGTALYGAVEVFIGPLLIAVVPIGLGVTAAGTTPIAQQHVTQPTSVLDRIFVSYSRRDADVVRACTALYRALGVQILMDTQDLRSGQDWRESLHRLISEADLFQLYWSQASATSSEVEHEWRYAQELVNTKGGGFIRPLYWQSPMPEPPPELSTIHFSRVDLNEVRSLADA
jgi:TIR domain